MGNYFCQLPVFWLPNFDRGKEVKNTHLFYSRERTALQRKEEIKDIDLDFNDRICFIEYLLLHYKVTGKLHRHVSMKSLLVSLPLRACVYCVFV